MSTDADMQISEHQLDSMTRDMEQMHRDTFPQTKPLFEQMGERLRTATSRRSVLLGGAALLGTATLAACGSSSKTSSSATTPAATSPSASSGASAYTGDYLVVALAASLENLAIAAYGLVLTNATAGKYGAVPPAVATFATTAKAQHTDHAAGWNSVLTAAKLSPITGTPLTIAGPAVTALSAATTIAAVATQAYGLENAAASTYLEAVGAVTDPGGIAVAATIAPVEAQHAAILAFVLGKYPVPASFLTLTGDVPPSAFTG